MKKTTLVTMFASLLLLTLSTVKAMAVSPSDFPACSNPQGDKVVSYDSGVHGIVGSAAEFRGSDAVYSVDPSKTMQCFCPSEGSSHGIQTDWFRAGSLSQNEINTYEHDGWVYLSTGKVWGLSDEPYLAKNQDYTCRGSSNPGGGSGSSSGSSNGAVQAASAILGLASLASTGNTITLLGVAIMGFVAFILSFLLRKSE